MTQLVGRINKSLSVNHQIRTKFEELKEEYNKLVTEFNWNQIIYKSTYSFIPVIGHTYHLYTNKDDVVFLSLTYLTNGIKTLSDPSN